MRPSAAVLAFPKPGAAAAEDREVEIKFDLEFEALPALRKALDRLGGTARDRTLRAVYHDTAHEDLRRAGFVLRVRDEDGAPVQTIKAEDGGGLFDRAEWETPVAGSAPDLKAARRTPLKRVLGRCGPLQPVFATHVQRTVRTVARAGASIEIALDVGEIEAEGRRAPVRQLELELKSGEPGALFELAAELQAAAPLRLSFETKSGMGYRLKAGEPAAPLKSVPAGLDKAMDAAAGFRAVAAACLRQIVFNAEVVREHRRPEALHQLRVGLRRLRTAVTLFKPLLHASGTARLKAELKWLSAELDAARDIDVFIAETYRPGAEALPDARGMAALGRRLLQAQTRAYDNVQKALAGPRGAALPLMLAEWIEIGGWTTAPALKAARARPLVDFADHALPRLRRRIKRGSKRLADLAPDQRHRVRIAAKKLRYSLEFFGPLYGRRRTESFVACLKAFQDSLGTLNDIAVARLSAAALVRASDVAEVGFAAGLVVGRKGQDEAALLKTAQARRDALIAARTPW